MTWQEWRDYCQDRVKRAKCEAERNFYAAKLQEAEQKVQQGRGEE